MGTSSQAVEVKDVLIPAAQANGSSSALQSPSGKSAAGQSGHSAQYWYGRAHRALKQRVSEPMQLMREYQHVVALDYSITHSSSAAKSRAAAGRNRYTNVLPYDYNRVVLQAAKAPYVNASTIQLQPPLLPRPVRYVATQGPLPATAADFWAIVVELGVPAVVMLTNTSECGMVKCCQYYPQQLHGVSRMGGYEVKVEQQVPFGPDCTLRSLSVTCSASGAAHQLAHYHFHAWPDHGTPDSSAGIRAICRALGPAHESGRPIIVHCSAGIGRTGTFCAIDVLLQRLDAWAAVSDSGSGVERSEVEDTLDVPKLVHELRLQRMGMVQTIEQYVFVYKALLDDLSCSIKGSGSSDGGGTATGGGSSDGGGMATGGGSSGLSGSS